MDHINWQRTRDVLLSIICIGIIFWASWNVLSQFVDAIVILLLSATIAFLLTPVVNFLHKYGVPRIIATLVTYVIVVVALASFAFELVVSLIQQANSFSDTVVKYVSDFVNNVPTNYQSIVTYLNSKHIPVANILSQVQSQVIDFAKSFTLNAITIVTSAFNSFIQIFLVTVLSFYMTLDGKRIRDSLISIVPKRSMSNVLLFEDALNRVVGNYIRGQLTLALIVGICTSLICLVSNLQDFALICGVLAFLFETIPMVGPGLASITPILLSLLIGGPDIWQRTIIIVGLFVILQILESNVLGPRIVGHAVGLHPVAAILSLLVGAKLFGVFGALLATPIVAALWVVVASVYRSARGETADQILAHKRAPWTIRRPNSILNERRQRFIKDGPRPHMTVVDTREASSSGSGQVAPAPAVGEQKPPVTPDAEEDLQHNPSSEENVEKPGKQA